MARQYGINGTPWHVERVHNNNPDDGRRHRSRCVWYDPKSKYCGKQVGDCYGASHCKYYKEGPRNLITTNVKTFETVQYVRPDSTFIPDTARDGTPENQIRVGDMVQKRDGRYMIVETELDEERHHVYSCVLAREFASKAEARGMIPIYSNWYLSDHDPVKCNAWDFGLVQHLPPSVVGRVKSERDMLLARKKLNGQKRAPAVQNNYLGKEYSVITYTGKFSCPKGIKVKQMYLVMHTSGKDKTLPIRVDKVSRVIYLEENIYKKYYDKIRNQKRYEVVGQI